MDRVRLGRALGKGARAAARTAIEAVDAASAPAPATPGRVRAGSPGASSSATAPAAPRPRSNPSAVVGEVLRARPALSNAGRAAAGSMLAPMRNASRALWHEVTGSFFALFALSFAAGTWHSRALAVSAISAERHRFDAFCVLALLFAYFSVSSFLRARRRDRK